MARKALTRKQIATVDRYGALEEAVKHFRSTTEKDYKEDLVEIQSWYEDEPAEDRFEVSGEKYNLLIHPRKSERVITSRSKLRKALGSKFEELWNVTLGLIDKWTTPDQQKSFLSEALTGSRKVEASPKI